MTRPTSGSRPRPSKSKKHAEIEYISIAGLRERMGPIGLHTYGERYLLAARSLPGPPAPSFDLVRSYLVCHSLELLLKAYLSLKGALMLELADTAHGHDLKLLLEEAKSKQLATVALLSASQEEAVIHVSEYYVSKVFEYPAVGEALGGYPGRGDVSLLLETATLLVDALRAPCHEAK